LQKYIEDPLSEALIQGSLPRPSELEVYLGDTGIYYRQIFAEGEAPGTDAPTAETPVTAGSAPTEVPRGTLLYTFEP
jgi:ATP-dependent Clp protease ATP-binding subunit ClpC